MPCIYIRKTRFTLLQLALHSQFSIKKSLTKGVQTSFSIFLHFYIEFSFQRRLIQSLKWPWLSSPFKSVWFYFLFLLVSLITYWTIVLIRINLLLPYHIKECVITTILWCYMYIRKYIGRRKNKRRSQRPPQPPLPPVRGVFIVVA